MLVAFLMGIASGWPLLLTGSLLQAWLAQAGIDLAAIGLTALLGLPYTVKFLWAPVLDRYTLPFLGRRRGWLAAIQVALAGAIIALGFLDPLARPAALAAAALLLAFLSASQDIVADAYRREALADAELGLGSSLFVNGYRLGMLITSGGGLILADHLPFAQVYQLLGAGMLLGLATTLLAPEPPQAAGRPATLLAAAWEPLAEYFRRPAAWPVLAFILLYKIGDQMAAGITMPFYLELGFSRTAIGAVVKVLGFWATVAGGLGGGILLLRASLPAALLGFGVLQALSTAAFALLAAAGPSVPLLAAVIGFENLASGMGTAAYVAFMASITHRRFTATQYALLSSLMGVPRVLAAAPTGLFAQWLGWAPFFLLCALLAVPGLVLCRFLAPPPPAAPPPVKT
ncbi:MAG: MFS transporter [Thermodesulfobacteriota bacterium]